MLQSRGQRARDALALLLVRRHGVDAALVARIIAERLGDERGRNGGCLVKRMHARAKGPDLRVVVLACQACRLLGPDERGPHACHAVGGKLLAVAGAANDDSQVPGRSSDCLGGGNAERGVVVLRVVLERPVVDDIVTRTGEVRPQVLLEFESGMVGGNVNAHDAIVPATRASPAAGAPPQRTVTPERKCAARTQCGD